MNRRLPFTLAFATFALILLLGPLQSYLVETAALTPFYTDEFTCGKLLGTHCGLLIQIAAGLQSCFVRPWLGASLFVALLVAIAYVQRWAFRVGDAWFGICWISPFALLVNYTQLGYLIYTLKYPAVAFAEPLGLLVVFCLVGLWFRLKGWRWKVAYLLLTPIVGFWLMGLFGALAIVPLAYRIPGIVALVFPLLFACFRFHGKKLWTTVAAASVFVAAGFASYSYSYLDANYLSILQMKHAAEDGKWEEILQIARDGEEEPTRAQVCLTRLALFKTGRMGDELFAYPEGSAAYQAPQNQWLRLMIGPLLYYHYGKLGFAYRWAMEDMVEYGERPAYLRYLHSVACLNGEDALAERYERALARTFYNIPLSSFYNIPLLFSSGVAHICAIEDAESASIRPLLNYTDQLDGDNGLVEFYLLNSFALSEGGSREMVELSLMSSLITKNLAGFWPRFMALLPTWQGHIPTHYQEAALMVAQLQGGAPVSDLPIDPAIQQRFQRLVEASARMGDNAANAVALRPEFGNTYWYYYFFVEELKTN